MPWMLFNRDFDLTASSFLFFSNCTRSGTCCLQEVMNNKKTISKLCEKKANCLWIDLFMLTGRSFKNAKIVKKRVD
jgi:hypothetical protein